MPLPVPPESSTCEKKKSPSSKTVPSNHGQSEKSWENYQANLMLYLPQGLHKKRSALEDVTNSSQNHPSQLKNETDKEFVKDISKKTKRNSPTLGLAEMNEMNTKKYKLEPLAVDISTITVPNTMERPLLLERSTIFQTPIIEAASLFKKPLFLKEELTNSDAVLTKSTLKKHTNQGEASLLEKPPSLKKGTNRFADLMLDPVIFVQDHETEKADLTKRALSPEKVCTYQGKQPGWREEETLQDITVQEPSFMEPMHCMKKPKTEEAVLTKGLSTLKEKCATQVEMSSEKKPLALQKTTSVENWLLKEPLSFTKKPTTEYSFFPEPSLLEKKHTPQRKVALLKMPLALQEKTTTKEEFYIKAPLEVKPTSQKEFLPPEPFSCYVQPTNKYEVTCGKDLKLQKTDTTEDSLQKLSAFCKKSTTEEEFVFKIPMIPKRKLSTGATPSRGSQLFLKKEPTAQGEGSFSKKQLALQENITSTSLPKPCLFLLEKPGSEKKAIPREPSALQKTPSSKKEVLSKDSFAFLWQSAINEILPLMGEPTTGQELSFVKPVTLQENPTHKEDTCLKHSLIHGVKTSPHVSSSTTECKTVTPGTAAMSSVSKLSTPSNISACESSSKKRFSSWKQRSQNEITSLKDFEMDHNYQFFHSPYAKDIFIYMKQREGKFTLKNYMHKQTDINSDMRAILVDWLVEVQMTFQVSHETLYLAVKLVDHYLMEVICHRSKLQLIGSTAFLIAAKFQESYPPCVDDFLYICDDVYQRKEMLDMEISILQTLKFDINIPVAYHFLRRYAMCLDANMNILTLSRFICEMSLHDYSYIDEKPSKLAAGCFLLALYMKKLRRRAAALEYYSNYRLSDLHPLVKQLNNMLTSFPCDNLKIVRSKYSNKVFFEVSKIPPLGILELEEIVNSCQF